MGGEGDGRGREGKGREGKGREACTNYNGCLGLSHVQCFSPSLKTTQPRSKIYAEPNNIGMKPSEKTRFSPYTNALRVAYLVIHILAGWTHFYCMRYVVLFGSICQIPK